MDPNAINSLAGFLKTNAGIILTQDKAYLVTSRLQPLAPKHGCKTPEELIKKLAAAPTAALKQDVIEAMTTNETSFFRDNTPFDNFKNHVIPALLDRRKMRKSIRILCMAASSGQEPYSLAMILAENAAKMSGWRCEILGVDIDTKILKRAEDAVYSQFEVQRGLPIQLLMKYFERKEDGNWLLKPIIRDMVKFKRSNLLEPFADLGQFDVVFCRNVLIYFDTATKKNILDRIAQQMPGDGFLFLGGAETVLDITDRFGVAPNLRGLYLPKAGDSAARVAAPRPGGA